MKQTAVEWLFDELIELNAEMKYHMITWEDYLSKRADLLEQAKAMEKEQMLNFGDFIIDELEPMAQNREWVEERYNYFKSE